MLYLSDECITVNPPLSLLGADLFQAHLTGGLVETWGLFEKGGLFNLEKNDGISSP